VVFSRGFPTTAVAVLVTGLVVIVAVIILPSAFHFLSTGPVNGMEQARGLVEKYLSGLNPDLRVKEIMEFSQNYYVRVQEESTGINAFELLVDRSTGQVSPEPGPNMMWNTKYGMMTRRGMMMMGSGMMIGRGTNYPISARMSVSVQDASKYAQKWLDPNFRGAEMEEAYSFYGYYTIDFSHNGQTIGMLSVNGYTGDVWYHTWHGEFIRMVEYE